MAHKIEAKILAHHAIARDVGAPALAGGGGSSGGSAGATVHAFTPQPKPVSDKKR